MKHEAKAIKSIFRNGVLADTQVFTISASQTLFYLVQTTMKSMIKPKLFVHPTRDEIHIAGPTYSVAFEVVQVLT
jgi:hypothetical protein